MVSLLNEIKKIAEPPVCHYGSNEPNLASQFEWSVNTFKSIKYYCLPRIRQVKSRLFLLLHILNFFCHFQALQLKISNRASTLQIGKKKTDMGFLAEKSNTFFQTSFFKAH